MPSLPKIKQIKLPDGNTYDLDFSSTFEGLTDVDINDQTLANGQVPKYNSTTQKWENGDASVVADLDDLGDVEITDVADGDIVSYDATEGEWVNQPKSLYPSAPILSWAEYQQLVDDEEDDPDAEYYIDDINAAEAYYVETSGQTAITGATSLTFTNSHITPTSDIRILAEPASCKTTGSTQYKVKAKVSSISSGSATISFPALAENTEFWLLINNPLAIAQMEVPLSSYIGMVIQSTTLDTEEKVKAQYGGLTWIQHSGYMLRGATSGVTANSATKTGGEDTHTLTVKEMPSHNHYAYGWASVTDGSGSYDVLGARLIGSKEKYTRDTGGGQAHNNLPSYKSVYIWERTA